MKCFSDFKKMPAFSCHGLVGVLYLYVKMSFLSPFTFFPPFHEKKMLFLSCFSIIIVNFIPKIKEED